MTCPPAGEENSVHNPTKAASGITDRLFRAAFHNSPAMHSIVRFSDAVLVEVNDTFLRALDMHARKWWAKPRRI